jgi:RNA-directed DNA polymerase
MRLPQPILESQWFTFDSERELISALGNQIDAAETEEILRLSALGLPPVTSREVLGTMIGVNSGFIWSLEKRPRKQYRSFPIKKGKGERMIFAPKVGLKIIQKWLSVQLQRQYAPPDHVFGFVPGRSHIMAAQVHCSAKWVLSNDIKEFFPSTPLDAIAGALVGIGYSKESARLMGELCCLNGALAQGSPASPILSNIVFKEIDQQLLDIADKYDCRITRYADDIVFSGVADFNPNLQSDIDLIIARSVWELSPEKQEYCCAPNRLKVHGLLVNGDAPRLTKGYRNRIRAYKHLIGHARIKEADLVRVKGHLHYASQVDAAINAPD